MIRYHVGKSNNEHRKYFMLYTLHSTTCQKNKYICISRNESFEMSWCYPRMFCILRVLSCSTERMTNILMTSFDECTCFYWKIPWYDCTASIWCNAFVYGPMNILTKCSRIEFWKIQWTILQNMTNLNEMIFTQKWRIKWQ